MSYKRENSKIHHNNSSNNSESFTKKDDKNNSKFGALGDKIQKSIGDDLNVDVSNLNLLDAFKSKNNRRGDTTGFATKEVSIDNRHKDEVESILNNTFNGNLFDAGVQALNLYNTGTKWTIILDGDIDKDKASFKYKFLYKDEFSVSENPTETGSVDSFLDSIEDPTVLGYSIKINFDTSPLFKEDGTSYTTFINNYKSIHKEMSLCNAYRDEFREGIEKIFTAPETLGDVDYKKLDNKNFYIKEVKNLDNLDNKFVKYSDKDEPEVLEFILDDDVRMYVNKLAILYRNLSWSYHLGKKLVPENLLRFNLYIKISDMRTFTTSIKPYDEKVKNGYSRVIYELKDCEFLFPESNLSNSISNGGVNQQTTTDFSTLSFKMKYRKVNRIFYSEMYSTISGDVTIIGDKFYIPKTKKYFDEVKSWTFDSSNTQKRAETTNNIIKGKSLSDRFDKLKNEGILKEKGSDNAATRFAKGLGNKAIKQTASIVDEGLNKVKNTINAAGNDVASFFDNNLNSVLRNFLVGDLNEKADLGKLHTNFDLYKENLKNVKLNEMKNNPLYEYDLNYQIKIQSEKAKNLKKIKTPLHTEPKQYNKTLNETISLESDFVMGDLNENLHNLEVKERPILNEILHENEYFKNDLNETLHENEYFKNDLNEILHENEYLKFDLDETLHENVYIESDIDEILHENVKYEMQNLNETLHENIYDIDDLEIYSLHENVSIKTEILDEKLHESIDVEDDNNNVNKLHNDNVNFSDYIKKK